MGTDSKAADIQQAVLEIDERLIRIQFGLQNIVQIRYQLLIRLIDHGHLQQHRVIVHNEGFDLALEHIVAVDLVHTIPIDVLLIGIPFRFPDELVIQMAANVIRKQRRAHIVRILFPVMQNERRALFQAVVEDALAGPDPRLDGGGPVIVPFPFIPIESGLAKNGVNHLRVWAGAESDHGAERCIRL